VLAFIEMMPLSLAGHCYSDQRKYSTRWRERKKTSKQRVDLLLLCLLLHVLTKEMTDYITSHLEFPNT